MKTLPVGIQLYSLRDILEGRGKENFKKEIETILLTPEEQGY